MSSKSVIRVLIVTALLLSVPLVAMQFTEGVNWTGSDFVIMGMLLLATGFGLELALAKTRNPRRLLIALAILLAFLFVWAELAVGVIGTPFAGS